VSYRDEVFICLRDAGKILTRAELLKLWEQRFNSGRERPAHKGAFRRGLDAAFRDKLIWRYGYGVYQARQFKRYVA
jgi:hypothetical protein